MINKFTTEILDKVVMEIKKDENQIKIKTYMVDPVICYIMDRLYPYIFFTFTIFVLILLISMMILALILRK